MSSVIRALLASLAGLLFSATTVSAQPTLRELVDSALGNPPPAATAAAATVPDRQADRGTPRSMIGGFRDAAGAGEWTRAARYLDLSQLGAKARADPAKVARQLKSILDHQLWIEPTALSAEPSGYDGDGLPRDRDLLGWIDSPDGPVEILLARGTENSAAVWRFAPETVARVPALYETLGYGRWTALLPSSLFDHEFLLVQLWQWLALLVLIVAASVCAWMIAAALTRTLAALARRGIARVPAHLVELSAAPLRLVLGVMLFAAGELTLDLALPVHSVLTALEKILLTAAMAWAGLRLLDIATERLHGRLLRRQQTGAMPLLSPGRRIGKALLVTLALIAMLDSLGFNITALLAGLGVGGIAVALAAQKSIENLFGGITLFADQPVRVGELCRFGDKIGTVEEIGLRSTRIRTMERTLITVPNAEFANLPLESFARRDKIWFHPTIGLRPDTNPEQIRALLAGMRSLLATHPLVERSSARVGFARLGTTSLDVEIFAYLETADYDQYVAAAEELNLQLMEIVAAAGAMRAPAVPAPARRAPDPSDRPQRQAS